MRKLLLFVSVTLLAWSALVVPLPLLVLSPVAARPVASIMEMPPTTDEATGNLLYTIVRVHQVTVVSGLAASLDPYRDVIRQGQVVPTGVDPVQWAEQDRRVFAESLRMAAAVGMQEAGLPVRIDGAGAQVVGLLPGAPAEGVLRPGDVIVAANDEPVRLASDLVTAVSRVRHGNPLQLAVIRGGDHLTIAVIVRVLPQLEHPGLGVSVATLDQRIELPIPVDVEEGVNVGGTSAGLMMALSVYDRVEPSDLARGRVIAGTGTVDSSGRVGRVDNVAEKVRGAELAGASVFLVPEKQAEEARAASPDEMAVIAVETVRDAISALQGSELATGG